MQIARFTLAAERGSFYIGHVNLPKPVWVELVRQVVHLCTKIGLTWKKEGDGMRLHVTDGQRSVADTELRTLLSDFAEAHSAVQYFSCVIART